MIALVPAGAGVRAALRQWLPGAGLVLAGPLVVAAVFAVEVHRRVAVPPLAAAVPQLG